MKTITLYDSLAPMFRNSGFGRPDPFEVLDRIFEADPFVGTATRSPVVDVREEEKSYVIEVELPGLTEKDLKLELKDGLLSLSTAKTEEREEKQGVKWLRRERRDYAFARSFLVPEDADGELVEAKFKDGLLTIELPKKPETAPRLVPVKAA
jgi:HSP20 family protein